MLNKQIPIKQDLSSRGALFVNSIFHTIQGEGPFAGTPSVFIRLSGCNLQCPSCDTEYTRGRRIEIMGAFGILATVKKEWTGKRINSNTRPLVVITGGEPFRQDIGMLVDVLVEEGFHVQIETNGTLFVDLGWSFASSWVTIVCSPKTGKVNHLLKPFIKAYKYVVSRDSIDYKDGLPILALDHSASPRVARPPENFTGDIFIQPIDVQDEKENARHLEAAVWSSTTFGYRLCLQIHKIIRVP